MIHAYGEDMAETAQETMGNLFELAVCHAHMEIDDFAEKFLASPLCPAWEKGDPIVLLGKSAAEMLAQILGNEPIRDGHNQSASPEYWLGWTLAYAQWYLNRPFATLLRAFPCSELILSYFPYHEMDVTRSVDLIAARLPKENRLQRLRSAKGLSQNDLALLSGVPARSIKAYEQGTVELSKAQGETLYALAKTLSCTVEELIEP